MKGRFVSVFIALGMILIIVLAGWYVRSKSVSENKDWVGLPRPKIIKTDIPQQKDFSRACPFFGKVKSRNRIEIIAMETGRIIFVNTKDETLVKKGTHLFTLGGPQIDGRLVRLKAKVATLQQRVNLAERGVVIKQKAVTQKFVKQGELLDAEDALARVRAEREAAEQKLHFIQVNIDIRAPFDSVFTHRKVSAGQAVTTGDSLAELVSLKHLRVRATLFPPKDTQLIGKKAYINLPQGGSIYGTVVKQFPQRTVDGAIIVWIEGADLDRRLGPGETISGDIVLLLHKRALAVPQSAIVRDEKEQTYIFLKIHEAYQKQLVQTGMVSDNWIEILSGLKKEDKVVIRGAYELFYRNFNKMYKVAD